MKMGKMSMNKIRIMECFGGIGALTKAFKRTGIPHEVVEYVEIDKYAVASYNAMNGTNFEPQDICKWDKDIEIDFLMHGSPCQDFSLAGLQAGGDEGSGTRSSLMYETIRIVEKLKPKYVVWENVKNLISKKHRHNFDAYLEKMEQLGYKNYWQVLNAKDYGIPQNRERVFTVSIRDDSCYAMYDGEEYYEDYTCDFKFPPKQELKLKLKDMLEENVDEKYYLSDDKIEKIAHWKAYQKPFEKVMGDNSVVPTLTSCGNERGVVVKDNSVYSKTEKQLFTEDGNIKRYIGSDVIDKFEEGQMATTTFPNGYGHGPRTHNESISLNTVDKPSVKVNLRIRKLTPKECFRLMGFDDESFEKAAQANSNSQLYKQAGNSIVVDVLVAIILPQEDEFDDLD